MQKKTFSHIQKTKKKHIARIAGLSLTGFLTLLTLAITTRALFKPTTTSSQAYVVYPVTNEPRKDSSPQHSILWKTNDIELSASDFFIEMNGMRYTFESTANSVVTSEKNSPELLTLTVLGTSQQIPLSLSLRFKVDKNIQNKVVWSNTLVQSHTGVPDISVLYAHIPNIDKGPGEEIRFKNITLSSVRNQPVSAKIFFKDISLKVFTRLGSKKIAT